MADHELARFAEHDAIKYGVIALAVLAAAWFAYDQFFAPNPDSYGDPGASALLGGSIAPGGENQDYEGYGILGTFAAGVNTLLFDAPDAIGNWLGGEAYNEWGD